jgi:tetratricopeptide (TPR) repeat protein
VADEEDRDVLADRIAQAIGLLQATVASEEIFWAVRKLIEGQARDRPVIVVIDDIHWAEPTLLDLVEHISEWSHEAPILLLCMTRPELLDNRPGWGGGKMNAVSILLEPLTEPESEQLIENLLGHTGLEQADRARIAEAAEGNPLYVEEMLSMLIEDGLLQRQDDHWVPSGDLAAVPVPPSIQALIAARLDRLKDEERQVIERASVIGKIFYRGAVTELSPEPLRSEVGGHLMTLVRKELIRPDRPAFRREETYRFRHLLIRDVAYQAMPKELRSELHEAFAGWLERAAGERAAEYEEILGYHLEQSFRYRSDLGPVDDRARQAGDRAAQLLASSGRRALRRGDASAASRLLSRAAELLQGESPKRLETLLDLSSALFNVGEWDRDRELLGEIVERARTIGDRRLEWRARTEMTLFETSVDPPGRRPTEELRRDALTALEVFEETRDDEGAARAWLIIAEIENGFGQNLRSIQALERARDHARALEDRRVEGELLARIGGRLYFGPTRPEEAIPVLEEFRMRSPDNLVLEAQMLRGIGRQEALRGHFERGREMAMRSRAILEELGLLYELAGFLTFAAAPIEHLAGEFGAEERELRAGIELFQQLGERGAASTGAGVLARLLIDQGRLEEAEHFVQLCKGWAVPDDIASQMLWRSEEARILARRGAVDEAKPLAQDAINIGVSTDFGWRGDLYVDLADVLRLAGDDSGARDALQRAIELYEEKGNVVLAERTRELLADST